MQYLDIREIIIEQIEAGTLAPKQRLPSERQLAASFNTTRITLREALSLLESEGRIYREDRRGWFIAAPIFQFEPATNEGFHQQARKQKRQPHTQLLQAQTGIASKQANALCPLPPFTQVHQIDRLLYLDDTPVAYGRYFFICKYFAKLLENDLQSEWSNIIKHIYTTEPARIDFEIFNDSFLHNKAPLLKIKSGTPALVLNRIYRTNTQECLYASQIYWRPESVVFKTISNYQSGPK